MNYSKILVNVIRIDNEEKTFDHLEMINHMIFYKMLNEN